MYSVPSVNGQMIRSLKVQIMVYHMYQSIQAISESMCLNRLLLSHRQGVSTFLPAPILLAQRKSRSHLSSMPLSGRVSGPKTIGNTQQKGERFMEMFREAVPDTLVWCGFSSITPGVSHYSSTREGNLFLSCRSL